MYGTLLELSFNFLLPFFIRGERGEKGDRGNDGERGEPGLIGPRGYLVGYVQLQHDLL